MRFAVLAAGSRIVMFAGLLALALATRLAVANELPNPERQRVAPVQFDSGGAAVNPVLPSIVATAPALSDETFSREKTRPAFAIESNSAAIYEPACNDFLFDKNGDRRVPPASLTKMMTALVTMDVDSDLNRVVNVNISAKELKRKTGSSVMGLEPGMRISIQDLLYGLMLPSGNDAAIVLANSSPAGYDGFIDLMNKKAAELGLANTHFTNPHGLDDPNLYSTAKDMARLGADLMQNPFLAHIAGTTEYRYNDIDLKNGNGMLKRYPGTFGVKIGFTDNAKHTVVAAADRDGRQLYVAVMGSEISYDDAIALLDWGFAAPRSC